MPTYANIGGAKQLASIYSNIGGSNKSLSAIYANIGGSSKIIFEGIKKYWYKRYNVTSWEVKKCTSMYDEDTDSFTETNNHYLPPYHWQYYNGDSYYLYKNYSVSTDYRNRFTLTGASKISWIPSENNGTGDTAIEKQTYIYYLGSNFNGYYCPVTTGCTSTTAYSSQIYHIIAADDHGSYMLEIDFSDGSERSDIAIQFDYLLWLQPTAHSSNYTLIGASAREGWGASSANKYSPWLSSNGTWYIDGYHLLYNIASSSISEATGAGYGGQIDTDDYDELYAYYFDGYYWEYLGYYA